jgi:hypothetical protein
MLRMKLERPEKSEYAEYYGRYIDLVPELDIVGAMVSQSADTQKFLGRIDDSRGGYRYAPEKWSICQLLGHIEDSERVFAYRALAFARGDKQAIPGYDQNEWMAMSPFDSSTVRQRAEALALLRRSTLELFRTFDEKAWARGGIASDNPVTVRALAYIIIGHERHHMRVLRERYAIAT